MNITSKMLLLISAAAYSIPFVLLGLVNILFPYDMVYEVGVEYPIRAVDQWLWMITDIGNWTGLVTFILGVLSWKKN